MMRVTCCYKCENRHLACHDTCEAYQQAKANNEEIHQRMLKDRIVQNDLTKIAVKRKERRRRGGKV